LDWQDFEAKPESKVQGLSIDFALPQSAVKQALEVLAQD